ncbi:hypothetical protein MMC13_003443 [Lambiella insularis]|nr:hypothetical protein [Lambiella insularis]
MATLYSRRAGKHNPKTLWVTDYIAWQDADLLSPTTASCGFKIYVAPGHHVPHFNSEEDYIARVKEYFTEFLDIFNVLRLTNPTSLIASAEKAMENARRPSVHINGLPSVQEDGAPPSFTTPAAPAPLLTSTPSSASPQRGVAKMNMLRRMRPPPFQHAWAFYHDKHSDHGNYEGRLTLLLENIITLKPFWEAYNSFPLDRLQMKDSVHFFKRGVKPVWEDPRNVKGGAWTFRVPKDKSEETWKEILLLAVGEQFADVIAPSKLPPAPIPPYPFSSSQRRSRPPPEDDLCGISLSVRFNSNLIMIWNRDGQATASIDGIRDVVLRNLSPELAPKENSYYYKQHSDHAGFSEVVAKAAEAALISGKIEEARVKEGEVERMMLEEQEKEVEEAEMKGKRERAQTVT